MKSIILLKFYLINVCLFVLIYLNLIFNALSSDLDMLFLNLKNAPDTVSAQTIENKIWNKWLSSGTDKVSNLQMKKGTVLLANGELDQALNLFVDLSKKQPYWAEPININFRKNRQKACNYRTCKFIDKVRSKP